MIFQNLFPTILLASVLGFWFDTNTCYANPGISVRVTKQAFDSANEIAINKFYEKFQNAAIPDMEKNGKLYYKLYNMVITSIHRPSGQVTLLPGRGLKWQFSLNYVKIHGNWRYAKKIAFFKIRHSGSMDVTLSNTHADVTIVPSMTSNGGLNIRATDCSCSTSLKIDVSNWFLKLLLVFFRHKVTRKLEDKICDSAISAINDKVAPKLTQYPLTETISNDYVLDYSLESNPIISSYYMQTNHKVLVIRTSRNSPSFLLGHKIRGNFSLHACSYQAMVHYKDDKRIIPFTPNSWPSISENKKMLYFIISNYVFDTWFFAAHRNNILKHKFNARNSRGKRRELLQTTCPDSFCIGTVLPKIAEKFPQSLMQISISTSDRPRMYFLPNRIQLILPTFLQFDVLLPNASLVNAFGVHLKHFAEAEAKVLDNKFFFTFSNITFSFSDISGIFEYDVKPLQKALQVVGDSLIPYFRDLGSTGMPITLPQETIISNPEFHVVNNAIVLGADLEIGSI